MNSLLKLSKTFLFLSLGLALLTQQSLQAGVRITSMGGLCAAYPLETDSVNPANLVKIGTQTDVGVGFLHQWGKSEIHDNQFGLNGKFNICKTRYWPAGTFGMNKMLNENLSVGIALKPLIGVKSRYNKVCGLFGTTPTKVELMVFALSPTVSYRFCKNHSIGFAFNIGVGREKYDGFQLTPNSVRPNHVTNNGYNYTRAVGFTVGYHWQVTPYFAFGIAYSPKMTLARFRKYDGLKPLGRISIPETFNPGIAIHPMCGMTITFDYVFAKLTNIATAHHSPFAPFPPGSAKGPGAGWNNVHFVSWGFEYKLLQDRLALRAGGIHARVPIPRHFTIGTPEGTGCNRNTYACGASWQWKENVELSFSVLHGVRNKIKGKNSIPLRGGGGNFDIDYSPTVVLFGYSSRM